MKFRSVEYPARTQHMGSYSILAGKCSGWRLLLIVVLLTVVHAFSHAQVDTGAIVGTVQDSSGANIPDATVTVTEEATGRKEATQTGPDGSFILSPLNLGAYTFTAEKQGFKTTTQSHIQVTIQARLEINPKLEIGSISQNVQVTSSGPILDTQSSSLQQLVGSEPSTSCRSTAAMPSFWPNSLLGSPSRRTIAADCRPAGRSPPTDPAARKMTICSTAWTIMCRSPTWSTSHSSWCCRHPMRCASSPCRPTITPPSLAIPPARF